MAEATRPEEWRPIPGYEGVYEASSEGRVRSLDRVFIRADGRRQGHRGRVLSPALMGKGYPSVMLLGGVRKTIHVLVCAAFHGPRPGDGYEVAHGNGDPTDNCVGNLRWATRSENQQDSIRHGTKYKHPDGAMAGARNHSAKVTPGQVAEIRRRWSAGDVSQRALATEYGIGKSQIHNIVSGKQWAPSE